MIQFQLRLSKKLLERQFEKFPQGALLLNENGEIVMVNHIFLQATGFELSSLLQQPFTKVISSIQPFSQWITQIFKSIQNDEPQTEITWHDSNGKLHRSPTIVHKGFDGNSSYYFITFLNLSMKDYLQQSLMKRFTKQLATDINLGVVIIDKNGLVVEVSTMVSHLLSLDKKEIINKHIQDVFSHMPEELRLMNMVLSNGINRRNHAMTWKKNHQYYKLLFDFNSIKDESEDIAGAYVLIQDVTDYKMIEQKATHHDRLAMIGQIAAGTAHEIRNPLTSVRGFLQMISKSLEENNLMKEKGYTDIMLTEIQRINVLVNEFLLLSKPKEVEYKTIDLNIVFSELMPFIENEALLHNVEVEFQSPGLLPSITGNSELLKQVFLNICKNGIEAMDEHGKLMIHHSYDEIRKQVTISIQDTGPGIPPQNLEKIFDPFYTTKEEGTGLGLPICQKIVHDMGGEIKVTSRENGTTFHVVLPCI